MISMFLLMISGGGCWITAKMLDSGIDPVKMGEQLESAQRQVFTERGSARDGNLPGSSGSSNFAEGPDELPEEIREAVMPK